MKNIKSIHIIYAFCLAILVLVFYNNVTHHLMFGKNFGDHKTSLDKSQIHHK